MNENLQSSFDRYIGIDYSGAQTPASSLSGLRIYMADRNDAPTEVSPPPSPRKYWTRRGIAEVYPSLWSRRSPSDGRTPDQHDAWCVAEWMQRADLGGGLSEFFTPTLSAAERSAAEIEGWILGLG